MLSPRGGWVGSEGAEVTSAVDGKLEAREPDLGAGPPPLVICVVEPGLNILGLLPSQTVTPLSPGRGGARAGAAGVRRVCGMSVGPSESDMSMSALRLFHINIEG